MTLAESLAAIVPLQAELNTIDDGLATLIVRIEEALRTRVSVRLSVAAWEGSRLCFGKVSGRWHLLIESPKHETILANCSREVRARVLKERLVEQLIVDAKAHIADQIEGRKAAVDAALSVLTLLAEAQP